MGPPTIKLQTQSLEPQAGIEPTSLVYKARHHPVNVSTALFFCNWLGRYGSNVHTSGSKPDRYTNSLTTQYSFVLVPSGGIEPLISLVHNQETSPEEPGVVSYDSGSREGIEP